MRSVTSALREISPKGVVRSLDIDLSNRSLAQDLKKKHGICCHVIMTSLEFLILSCFIGFNLSGQTNFFIVYLIVVLVRFFFQKSSCELYVINTYFWCE